MASEIITFEQGDTYRDVVRRAAGVLFNRGLVVFPTDTVYGVAARGDDEEAVRRLRCVKHRTDDRPFTVHIGRREELARYIPAPGGVGRRLARKGWPGPLTLLFAVPDVGATAIAEELGRSVAARLYHDGVIGLRCPDEPRTRDLLNEVGVPVFAASANVANRPPPRTAQEALRDLDGQVDLVLDGGPTRWATPSTIVQVEGPRWRIIRQGVHDERALTRMASLNILFVCTGNTCRSPMAAGLFRRMLSERLGGGPGALETHAITVASAGVAAGTGSAASDLAGEVMAGRGIDLSAHRSQPLRVELINQADLIFVMTQGHFETVVQMSPPARKRCRLVCQQDVQDPLGGDRQRYEAVADQLETCLRALAEEIEL
jgi:L-threonylcarbamoyladenylate synthase